MISSIIKKKFVTDIEQTDIFKEMATNMFCMDPERLEQNLIKNFNMIFRKL